MKRMRLNFILWMLLLFFGLAVLLLPITAAYAQPTNPTQSLAIDLYTELDVVQYFEIWDGAIALPESDSLKNVFTDHIIVYSLQGRSIGLHSYRVRAFVPSRTVTNPDGSKTIYQAGYSGFSNSLLIRKLQVLDLDIVDGFLVTTPQAGIVSTKIYIDDTTYIGLAEPSPDAQWLRIYDISAFSAGTYNIWANATHESLWEGDYQANPLVVNIVPASALPVPALGIR